MIGTTFAHYRITSKLGEGAMGTVWEAEDVRLRRTVALKFIPPMADDAAVARFESEAQLASTINHPHIVAIYDVGEFEGRRFIAMERVPGGSLRDRLARGPMKLREALTAAIELADALAAAHRAGIVHRDVKPDNVLMTLDGRVKLSDFGIAKLYEPSLDADRTLAGTISGGGIVGTPHYLAPEQIAGEPVDGRADIFAFAATLHEMVTGRRAFEGATLAQTLARISGEDPVPARDLNASLPADLERVILKGLEKDRDYRYQHVDEIAADLRRLRRDLELKRPSVIPETAPRSRTLRSTVLAAAGVAAGVAGTLLLQGWSLSETASDTGSGTFALARITTEPGTEHDPSWSPDGRSVVYVADDGKHLELRVRQVPGERALRIGRQGVDEAQPVYSPDGQFIAFVSSRDRGGRLGIFLGSRAIESYVSGQGGDLFVMPALGGSARKLAEHAYDPTWSPDGQALAFRSIRDNSWRIYTVAVAGGAATAISGVEPRAIGPAWSPDGRWIAYIGEDGSGSGWDLHVIPAAGGTPVRLTTDAASIALRPAWTPDGRALVYPSNRGGPLNLWRVAFDPDAGNAQSAPQRVTTGIGEDISPSVAKDGSVVYAAVETAPDIWRLDVATGQLTPLTADTSSEDYPRVSPDGTKLLFYSDRTGRAEVWMRELQTGEDTQISREGGTHNAWSPDGATVAYGTTGGLVVHELRSGRTRVINPRMPAAYPRYSPDGRRIAYQARTEGRYRLYLADLESGRADALPIPDGEGGDPSWSPDGRTIWFQLDQLGQRNIWALDLSTGRTRQITTGDLDDAHPDVSADGRQVLFLRGHSELHVMPAAGGPSRLLHRFDRQLVEWPNWIPGHNAIVFSLTRKTGDLFVLSPDRK